MKIEEKPTWKEGLNKSDYPKLDRDVTADVAIIGGGLAGILTAYRLVKNGKKVVVLEKKHVGSGATEYTTAFITQDIDTDLNELVKMFGEENARLVWQSGADAIDLIEKIVTEEKIECEFTRTSVYSYANDNEELEHLTEEQRIVQRYGFPASDIKLDVLGFVNAGHFELKNQAKFHPLKFLTALAAKVVEMGAEIYEQSEVTKIDHTETGVNLEVGERKITAGQVVVATYQPFHNRIRLFLQRGMYRSYVLEARIRKGMIKPGLYWDSQNPYHYFRIDTASEFDRMILGGEDIKTIFKTDPEKSFARLEEYLQKILKGETYEITRKWVGPILEPSDGLPLIGELWEREYVATAFSGNGMTYSAISSMILSDAIMGRANIYAQVYDPNRIPTIKQLIYKGRDYFEELFGGVAKNIGQNPNPAEG